MEYRRVFINKTRLHLNHVERTGERDYKNRTKILLFVPGMLFYKVNSLDGQVNGQEPYTANFITKNGIDSAYFNWSSHTKKLKSWREITIENYVKELKSVIDYLIKIGYSTIFIKSTSFGSVPLIELLDRYDYSLNIKKIIMDGANFSSAIGHLNHQISKNSLWKKIGNKKNFKLLKSYETLKSQKDTILKYKYSILFFVGNNETQSIKDEILNFSKNNNSDILYFENMGHLVYDGDSESVDKYNAKLLDFIL